MNRYIDVKVHYKDLSALFSSARLTGELITELSIPEVMLDLHDVHAFVAVDIVARLLFPDDAVMELTDADIQAEHDAAADSAALEHEASGGAWPR